MVSGIDEQFVEQRLESLLGTSRFDSVERVLNRPRTESRNAASRSAFVSSW